MLFHGAFLPELGYDFLNAEATSQLCDPQHPGLDPHTATHRVQHYTNKSARPQPFKQY